MHRYLPHKKWQNFRSPESSNYRESTVLCFEIWATFYIIFCGLAVKQYRHVKVKGELLSTVTNKKSWFGIISGTWFLYDVFKLLFLFCRSIIWQFFGNYCELWHLRLFVFQWNFCFGSVISLCWNNFTLSFFLSQICSSVVFFSLILPFCFIFIVLYC